ncbi:MAG: PQQ-binding-like beta-propeller repeat protein, partial [Akkermansiaceae bacterium]|nr:PQQ-binding-like beta-propeller repeat protein [Akkermansiaceae bacterium]
LIGQGGSLSAHARTNGELLWKASLPGRVHGLAIANGTLFASTSLGTIHAFGP